MIVALGIEQHEHDAIASILPHLCSPTIHYHYGPNKYLTVAKALTRRIRGMRVVHVPLRLQKKKTPPPSFKSLVLL